uniref:USP domain-containing protein n=1 Tax=Salix viminalis TaxID=40686 RepID=A0A6N2KGE2_SALVM
MMGLTVEIHGDAASLEECLDQFIDKEWLHGENMYKCNRCNNYVKAWKRLTIQRAPNVLTIALKRFQKGRYGGDGTDVYKLYAVVVHVDMLNASFFGHYICYTKDFHGNWHRIDDNKTRCFSGAYMLVYNRVSVRPSCLEPLSLQRATINRESLMLYIQHLWRWNWCIQYSYDPDVPACNSEEKLSEDEKQDEVTNFKDKKQNKIHLLMGQLPKVSKGIIMNDISAGKGMISKYQK